MIDSSLSDIQLETVLEFRVNSFTAISRNHPRQERKAKPHPRMLTGFQAACILLAKLLWR
eukprot:6484131-Amphidinium_carterae.1